MIKLPERNIIRLRNEVDRYGFSYLIANKVGLHRPPRAFSTWMHGWYFWQPEILHDVGYDKLLPDTPVVVSTDNLKAFMERHGFTNVTAGGLPFAYTDELPVTRIKDSLIAFIPHSIIGINKYILNEDVLDYMYSIKNDFEHVYLCIYAQDIGRKELIDGITKRGLRYIAGAQPDDANSLLRMRTIFQSFEYVLSFGMGSHLLYASYCGCKTSISGPYPDIMFCDQAHNNPSVMERVKVCHEKEMNIAKYPWFFVNHPREAVSKQQWARSEIGPITLLDNDDIIRVLGWNKIGYMKGILRAIRRRAKTAITGGISNA